MCSYLTISESGSGIGEKIWFTEVLGFDSEIPQSAMNQVKEFAMLSSASVLVSSSAGQRWRSGLVRVVSTGYFARASWPLRVRGRRNQMLTLDFPFAFHFQSLELFVSGISSVVHVFYLFPVQTWLRATGFWWLYHYTFVPSTFLWALTTIINFLQMLKDISHGGGLKSFS